MDRPKRGRAGASDRNPARSGINRPGGEIKDEEPLEQPEGNNGAKPAQRRRNPTRISQPDDRTRWGR